MVGAVLAKQVVRGIFSTKLFGPLADGITCRFLAGLESLVCSLVVPSHVDKVLKALSFSQYS